MYLKLCSDCTFLQPSSHSITHLPPYYSTHNSMSPYMETLQRDAFQYFPNECFFFFGCGKSKKCRGYFLFIHAYENGSNGPFAARRSNSFSISLIAVSNPGNWSSSHCCTRHTVAFPTRNFCSIVLCCSPAISMRAMIIRRPSMIRSLGVSRSRRNNLTAFLPCKTLAAVYNASSVAIVSFLLNSRGRLFIVRI